MVGRRQRKPLDTTAPLYQQFEAHLPGEKSLMQRLRAYERALDNFDRFCAENSSIADPMTVIFGVAPPESLDEKKPTPFIKLTPEAFTAEDGPFTKGKANATELGLLAAEGASPTHIQRIAAGHFEKIRTTHAAYYAKAHPDYTAAHPAAGKNPG